MTKIFAFANMKGGVGKSTTAVMFAQTLASRGRSVLFVDLDAQASSTYALIGYEKMREASEGSQNLAGFFAKTLAMNKFVPMDDFILRGQSNLTDCPMLDLVCSHPEIRVSERTFLRHVLKTAKPHLHPEKVFAEARAPLCEELLKISRKYDYVVIDCPPGISLFVEAGATISDCIVSPTKPEPLSTLGFETIINRFYNERWFRDEAERLRHAVPAFRVLFNMVKEDDLDQLNEINKICQIVSASSDNLGVIGVDVPNNDNIALAFSTPEIESNWEVQYASFREIALGMTEQIIQDRETVTP